MFSPEVFIAAVITLTITAGLSWLFYPAWVSATADVLEWDEVKVKQGQPQDTPILLSIVVPAYNEEDRIPHMIKSAHHFLVSTKGRDIIRKLSAFAERVGCAADEVHDIEWIVVDDGSSDGTCLVVASLAKALKSIHTWKIISLKNNSGKGAAIKTGMDSAKGHFSLMVDADGATEFGSGLEKLIEKLCLSTQNPNQPKQQMISIFGSRAHMQEESTTTRSIVRTLLMRVFHFFVSLLVSSSIQDTQCGFKLFTKEASQAVFGNLKLQRWAFDTEVVLLCKYLRIDIYEVPVHWQEIDGSKLNTSKWALAIVSITMLRDMICVRACYLLGIWNVSKVVSKDQVR